MAYQKLSTKAFLHEGTLLHGDLYAQKKFLHESKIKNNKIIILLKNKKQKQ